MDRPTELKFQIVLIRRLVRRDFETRYRGSILGVLWSVIVPLAMLTIYALVFGTILGARWGHPETGADGEYNFAMLLFPGLIMFGMFADVAGRAPNIVVENTSYVKKFVFPLQILPVVLSLSALATSAISFGVFFLLFSVLFGLPSPLAILFPVILVPFIAFVLGTSYFFASLGVFLRDLGQLVPPLSTALLFTSTIFFPLQSIPDYLTILYRYNPLSLAVEHFRSLVFWNQIPSMTEWSAYLAFSLLFLAAGHAWFERTKKAFADVV